MNKIYKPFAFTVVKLLSNNNSFSSILVEKSSISEVLALVTNKLSWEFVLKDVKSKTGKLSVVFSLSVKRTGMFSKSITASIGMKLDSLCFSEHSIVRSTELGDTFVDLLWFVTLLIRLSCATTFTSLLLDLSPIFYNIL